MSSEWPVIEIGKVAQLFDGPHATPQKTSRGPVFLGISSLKRGMLDLSSTEHLSEDDFAKWTKRVVPQAEDVVFSYETRIGEVAIIPQGLRCCLGRRMALLRPDRARLVPKYLLYYFLSEEFQALLRARTVHGSTVERLPLTDFPTYPVRIPPVAVQEAISSILQTLDDRITLLRETNATLEAIAQALFKSWFVDFDPVHAKMEGRAPEGMDEATAALFPDSLEETEFGVVPRGWRVGTVANLGEVICGKTPPTSNPENYGDEVPFITIPDMHGFLVVTATNRSLSRTGADGQKKKYLPPGTVCVSCIATPGLVIRVTTESQTNQQINSVVPFSSWGKSFPLFLLRRIGDAVRAGGSGGSVFHNLSKSGFEELKVLLTSSEVAHMFDEFVEPLTARIESNQRQAQTLSTLRDTLLPRLISGQLQLPEVTDAN